MSEYIARIAIRGATSSWRHTRVSAATAARALVVAEKREIDEGYEPVALMVENIADAHDVASKGVWPWN